MKPGILIELPDGASALVLGKGGEFVPPGRIFAGWANDSINPDDEWEWSPTYSGTVERYWYAVPYEVAAGVLDGKEAA